MKIALQLGHLLGRSGNAAAHAMARFGLSRSEDYFWVEEATVAEDRRLFDPP